MKISTMDSKGIKVIVCKGEKGDKGNNGYNPVRGTDYWTESDIASISADLDSKIENALIQDTASGTTAETEFALETTAKNYRIYGNCTQNGTPTPTAPIEIECVGDLVTDTTDNNYGKYKIAYKNTVGAVVNNYVVYLNEPLRKIGNYADYIDYKNQKVVRKIETKTFVGTEVTYSFSANNYVTYGIANVLYPNGGAISNRYIKMVGSSDLSIASKSYGLQITDSTNTSSQTSWKSKLAEWNTAGNPLKVYYVLATPTEETITLSPMPLKEDTNNISCTTVTQPSKIEVTYYQNPTMVINSLKNAIVALQSQTE